MPLKKATNNTKKAVNKAIGQNIKELKADNKKSGKAKGASGKPRSQKQIVSIAINAAKKK